MATLTIELPPQVTQGQMMAMLESIGCDLRLSSDGRNYTAVPKGLRQREARSHLVRIANKARHVWEYQGGYVILKGGEVAGWVLYLENPQSWEPGAVAIDEAGRMWVSAGGNTYDGAERWEPLGGDRKVVHMPARRRQARHPTPPGAA